MLKVCLISVKEKGNYREALRHQQSVFSDAGVGVVDFKLPMKQKTERSSDEQHG
jgi:hypothetical protein